MKWNYYSSAYHGMILVLLLLGPRTLSKGCPWHELKSWIWVLLLLSLSCWSQQALGLSEPGFATWGAIFSYLLPRIAYKHLMNLHMEVLTNCGRTNGTNINIISLFQRFVTDKITCVFESLPWLSQEFYLLHLLIL